MAAECTYKNQKELAKENPGGMEKLSNPHNFSSNPGFMSTDGMLGASTPAGGGGIQGTSARGAVPIGQPARPVLGFRGPVAAPRPVSPVGPARPVSFFSR